MLNLRIAVDIWALCAIKRHRWVIGMKKRLYSIIEFPSLLLIARCPEELRVSRPAVHGNGGIALHKYIVANYIIHAASKHNCAAHLIKEVVFHDRTTQHIVVIDSHGSHADAAQVVNVIMTDMIPAKCHVTAGINRPRISGFKAHAINLIILDAHIIAAVQNGNMGTIVD